MVAFGDQNSKSQQNLQNLKRQSIHYQNQINKARENRPHLAPAPNDETSPVNIGDLQRIKSMPLFLHEMTKAAAAEKT